mmetsp:Transcript_38342/g.114536  ORF Transcript_38342/g.114536 Transcript_38342/m.114536 type:complete len:247 (-) Transcript_38342:1129-1869(-)
MPNRGIRKSNQSLPPQMAPNNDSIAPTKLPKSSDSAALLSVLGVPFLKCSVTPWTNMEAKKYITKNSRHRTQSKAAMELRMEKIIKRRLWKKRMTRTMRRIRMNRRTRNVLANDMFGNLDASLRPKSSTDDRIKRRSNRFHFRSAPNQNNLLSEMALRNSSREKKSVNAISTPSHIAASSGSRVPEIACRTSEFICTPMRMALRRINNSETPVKTLPCTKSNRAPLAMPCAGLARSLLVLKVFVRS